LFEVRADGARVIYRVLFAREGEHGQVLLLLVAFNKKIQKTPPAQIELAARLALPRPQELHQDERSQTSRQIACLIYQIKHD
jgi:phage-related protein